MNIKVKAGISATAFGVLYSVVSYMMPRAAIGNPIAPMIFPMVLGLGLIVVGGLYTAKEYKLWQEEVKKDGVKEVSPEEAALNKKTNKLIVLTCLSGLGYALLFEQKRYSGNRPEFWMLD